MKFNAKKETKNYWIYKRILQCISGRKYSGVVVTIFSKSLGSKNVVSIIILKEIIYMLVNNML